MTSSVPVEPLEADLLGMTEDIDRDTATISFQATRRMKDTLTTREALEGELRRLQDLGWIDLNPQDRWAITSAGREALSAAREFVFEVDDVLEVKEDVQGDRQDIRVKGRLRSGSLTFFQHAFAVLRDGVEEDLGGFIQEVRSTEDPGDLTLVVSLRLWGTDRHLKNGDLLRREETYIGKGDPDHPA